MSSITKPEREEDVNSHSVRKLRTCCLCSDLGIYKPSEVVPMPLVICIHGDAVPPKQRSYVHPRCYLKKMGRAKLLSMPDEELGEIRICDVAPSLLRAIMKKIYLKGKRQ
jgi:hypothetical protein